MSKSSLDIINKFLSKCEEIESKATAGEWIANGRYIELRYSTYTHHMAVASNEFNSDAIAFSKNTERAKLAAIKLPAGAFYDLDCRDQKCEHNVCLLARMVLTRIAELLSVPESGVKSDD